jgi:hypothetical protein
MFEGLLKLGWSDVVKLALVLKPRRKAPKPLILEKRKRSG